MAVAVVMSFEGATLEQYDQVLEKMGLEHQGAGPPGALFHWVTSTDEGMLITDVWEDQETFERFAKDQIGPYSAEVGIEKEPKTAIYEVHNYLTAG